MQLIISNSMLLFLYLWISLATAFAAPNANSSVVQLASEHYALYYNSIFPMEAVSKLTIPTMQDFEDYIVMYGKKYASVEKEERFAKFQVNSLLAQALQFHDKGTATYGTTKFSDLSTAEFRTQYLGYKKPATPSTTPYATIPRIQRPTSVDWVAKGAVTAVKNQGQCKAGWAFSAVENIEGQWFLKKGQLISLSEAELIDCDQYRQGCNCSFCDYNFGFEQVVWSGGLVSEKDYPYDTLGQKCNLNKSQIVATISSSVQISKDEGDMATWCAANGPISIVINADNMQLYKGGVAHPSKTSCSPAGLDHSVLITGYGMDGETPYWTVKNSWGADWGEQGYYRVYRGGGVCGLNEDCGSAVVN